MPSNLRRRQAKARAEGGNGGTGVAVQSPGFVFPVLNLPPRPQELPSTPPPASSARVREEAEKTGSPLGKLLVDGYSRGDAHLTGWVDEEQRVLKEGWQDLQTLVAALDARILALETRVADTYTWGQKGTLTVEEGEPGEPVPVTLLALPLRIVRDEEMLECTAAAEVPGLGGVLLVQHQASGEIVTPPTPPTRADEIVWTDVATLTIEAEMKFVSVILPEPFKMKKDDTLRVVIAEVVEAAPTIGEEPEELSDVVVQARCR
jgi:hypothetical protein